VIIEMGHGLEQHLAFHLLEGHADVEGDLGRQGFILLGKTFTATLAGRELGALNSAAKAACVISDKQNMCTGIAIHGFFRLGATDQAEQQVCQSMPGVNSSHPA
jgi:hypothetical protein